MNDWQKAAKIVAQAREYAKEVCKVGVKYITITDKVEDFIRKKGAGIAFPMDVSANSMAAHDSPFLGDERIIEKGDVVKLDIGAHINGHVADNACTVEVGTNNWKELIKASEEACKAACEKAVPGAAIHTIGKAAQETIANYGFVSITNLSGHGVGLYEVHIAPTIPNYDNGDTATLEEGQHIAIEPFATDGKGSVKEGKGSGVYQFLGKKPVRLPNARKLLQFIETEYKTLPFSERWLGKFQNVKFLLKLLERADIVHEYPQLPEAAGGMVSQHENTVEVGTGVISKV